MKFLRLLTNIAIGVALFFLASFFVDKSEDGWWPVLAIAGIAIVGKILGASSSSFFMEYLFLDIFHYSIIFAGYALINFVAWTVLPFTKFDTFFAGALLFLGSAMVLGILAKYVLKGIFAIIDFSAWGENPAQNFMRISIAFIALLSGVSLIGGVMQCGLAGALSLFGILIGLIPNEYSDAVFQSTTETESEPQEEYRDSVTLSNGKVVTDNGRGMFMDSNCHEWKKDSNGNWYDDGFRF